MNASMVGAWNGVVAPGDTVYYLGDFAMQPQLVAEILPQLNGTKVLIAGNHDRCHPKIGSPDKWLQFYLESGFTSVQIEMEMEIGDQNVLLHHFPY
jgi:calcineurin-like phosphoesterase family protein